MSCRLSRALSALLCVALLAGFAALTGAAPALGFPIGTWSDPSANFEYAAGQSTDAPCAVTLQSTSFSRSGRKIVKTEWWFHEVDPPNGPLPTPPDATGERVTEYYPVPESSWAVLQVTDDAGHVSDVISGAVDCLAPGAATISPAGTRAAPTAVLLPVPLVLTSPYRVDEVTVLTPNPFVDVLWTTTPPRRLLPTAGQVRSADGLYHVKVAFNTISVPVFGVQVMSNKHYTEAWYRVIGYRPYGFKLAVAHRKRSIRSTFTFGGDTRAKLTTRVESCGAAGSCARNSGRWHPAVGIRAQSRRASHAGPGVRTLFSIVSKAQGAALKRAGHRLRVRITARAYRKSGRLVKSVTRFASL